MDRHACDVYMYIHTFLWVGDMQKDYIYCLGTGFSAYVLYMSKLQNHWKN